MRAKIGGIKLQTMEMEMVSGGECVVAVRFVNVNVPLEWGDSQEPFNFYPGEPSHELECLARRNPRYNSFLPWKVG